MGRAEIFYIYRMAQLKSPEGRGWGDLLRSLRVQCRGAMVSHCRMGELSWAQL